MRPFDTTSRCIDRQFNLRGKKRKRKYFASVNLHLNSEDFVIALRKVIFTIFSTIDALRDIKRWNFGRRIFEYIQVKWERRLCSFFVFAHLRQSNLQHGCTDRKVRRKQGKASAKHPSFSPVTTREGENGWKRKQMVYDCMLARVIFSRLSCITIDCYVSGWKVCKHCIDAHSHTQARRWWEGPRGREWKKVKISCSTSISLESQISSSFFSPCEEVTEEIAKNWLNKVRQSLQRVCVWAMLLHLKHFVLSNTFCSLPAVFLFSFFFFLSFLSERDSLSRNSLLSSDFHKLQDAFDSESNTCVHREKEREEEGDVN